MGLVTQVVIAAILVTVAIQVVKELATVPVNLVTVPAKVVMFVSR